MVFFEGFNNKRDLLSFEPPPYNAIESLLGEQPPLGIYDPLGLLDNADQERFGEVAFGCGQCMLHGASFRCPEWAKDSKMMATTSL